MKSIALALATAFVCCELMTVAAKAQSCPVGTSFRCYTDAQGHKRCGCMR